MWYKLNGGAVAKEFCYTMNQGSLQIILGRWQSNVIFWEEGSRVFRSYNSIWLIRNYMCVRSLNCLKLKYPSFFSAQWASRDLGTDVST
jgi:hypothetical protein